MKQQKETMDVTGTVIKGFTINPCIRLMDGEIMNISHDDLSSIYKLPSYLVDKHNIMMFATYTSAEDGRSIMVYSDDDGRTWMGCRIKYPDYESYEISTVSYNSDRKFFSICITTTSDIVECKNYTSPDGLAWYYEVSRDMIPGYEERTVQE